MTGDAFISFGQRLAGQYRSDPAAVRTVTSRCYYGVFHIAKSLLERLGHYGKGDNPHLFVQRCFQYSGIAAAVKLGDLLASLHEQRKRADYDLNDARCESLRFAETAILRASELRDALSAFEVEPARTTFSAGVAAHWRKLSAKGPAG